MSTHNIFFYGEIWKLISKLSSNTLRICSTARSAVVALLVSSLFAMSFFLSSVYSGVKSLEIITFFNNGGNVIGMRLTLSKRNLRCVISVKINFKSRTLYI